MAGNNSRNRRRADREPAARRFTISMQRKLVVLFILVLLAFVGLGINIYAISRDNGNTYKKQVLSQQSYDSRVIDYKRGTIMDAKGTVLADSELVYDVIIDAKQMLEKEYYLEPSLRAISRLGIDADKIRQYVTDNPDSQYYIAMKNLSYDAKTQYDEELRVGRATEAKRALIRTALLRATSSASPTAATSALSVWKSTTMTC